MIRICHMTSVHKTTDTRVFLKECISAAKAGYDVYLVGQGESREQDNVKVVGVGKFTGGRLSRMIHLTKKIYNTAISLDADIYHFHDPELLLYGLKLKQKGKKVIYDCHEFYAQQIKGKSYLKGFANLIAKIYEIIERFVVKRLDAVVAVTPRMADDFRKFQSNVAIIGNYPILQYDSCVIKKQKLQICFAGGISEQWNHETILRAMEQIPEVNYKLCGPVEDEKYLVKLKSMPASDRMDYMGVVPFARAQELLQSSSIGIVLLTPSGNTDGQNGTMGNTKLFEIMMAGLPVICTDFVLWKEIIGKYECGICISPNDSDALTNAIRFLLSNPEEAQRMGRNGACAIRKVYNWDKLSGELNKMYQKVGGGVRAIYAGSLTADRGITNLVQSIQYCDAQLVLCGKFDSNDYQKYVLSMIDKIDYRGQLSYAELLEVYKKCSIGLCTLEKTGQYATLDTLATKIYEYMMCGLPVVITNTPYNCKMIKEYGFGICVDPSDIKAVASVIQYYVEHPVEAYICGKNGYKAYIEHFNWSNEEQKLLKLYKEILI